MITVRTKGVPLKREMPIDAEGFAVFNLDETKFDPFEIMLTTLAKAGRPDVTIDARFDAMMRMQPHELARFDAAYAARVALKDEQGKR